jgi:nicotinate phosphoribosyltransferase
MIFNNSSNQLALLTDLYQLSMCSGYRDTGIYQHEAVFHLYFRKHPFGGNYTVAAGLEQAIQYLENLHFSPDDIYYLASLQGNDGRALFSETFLNMLQRFSLACHVDAVPEGTILFPNQPLLRISGPIWQCQLVETTLLNLLNFSSLIATKASRIVHAAQGDEVFEFGLRRAQGIDGALTASRAAYIGGCTGTSNVLAGKLYNIPVRGTHAHSWVMSFDNEQEALLRYAQAMPNNATLLVDTYDTLEGIQKAIEAGKWLRQNGHHLAGIRLDSGNLAELSKAARTLLNEAGFQQTNIVASNDLDEYAIAQLKKEGAPINVWGVGTKLVTAYDQPALGGVYKLAAIRSTPTEAWKYKIKRSEQPEKTTTPGIHQVARYTDNQGIPTHDVIYDIHHPVLPTGSWSNLLTPIFRDGKRVYDLPSLPSIAQYAQQQRTLFAHLLNNPQATFRVDLSAQVRMLKEELLRQTDATK